MSDCYRNSFVGSEVDQCAYTGETTHDYLVGQDERTEAECVHQNADYNHYIVDYQTFT